jgi:hypothetical protein
LVLTNNSKLIITTENTKKIVYKLAIEYVHFTNSFFGTTFSTRKKWITKAIIEILKRYKKVLKVIMNLEELFVFVDLFQLTIDVVKSNGYTN